jgi:2-(1,2-epoxy-1,2-dihydrophenyl)acetyl-CoA isomerase
MDDSILVTIDDRVARIVLNRPENLNPLDLPLAKTLIATLLRLGADSGVLGIVITGAGKAFSAGGDLRAVNAHAGGPAAAFDELAAHANMVVLELRRMPKPVIAAINGVAAGGGFSLALACDFRVMAASAKLKQGFTSNGLCLDGGATFHLPRLVGLARAMEIAAFDAPIDSGQALDWGLVTRVAADDRVVDEATAMAQALGQRSLHSFAWSKRLLGAAYDTALAVQLEEERAGLVDCVSHPDGQEGMAAFFDKRPPTFNRPG